MIEAKLTEIRNFCIENTDIENIKKYSRYFKDGFDGYGINQKVFEKQKDAWISEWKDDMNIDRYLQIGDDLILRGKLEEKSLAIFFLKSERENFTPKTFDRISKWFNLGIDNWATTDVLCMLVLSSFLIDNVISFDKLKSWGKSESEWQRRAVPVTLNELIKKGIKPSTATPLLEPLMLDDSQYVQKGIGTLLRGLWKRYPQEIESFLLKWKDTCGRLIVQYATEKMDKDARKKYKKSI